MGYRITYGQTVIYKKLPNKKAYWRRILAGIIVLALLGSVYSVKTYWKRLLPGDADATYLALSHMVENLESGEPMYDAVTAFCRELVSYDK